MFVKLQLNDHVRLQVKISPFFLTRQRLS